MLAGLLLIYRSLADLLRMYGNYISYMSKALKDPLRMFQILILIRMRNKSLWIKRFKKLMRKDQKFTSASKRHAQ